MRKSQALAGGLAGQRLGHGAVATPERSEGQGSWTREVLRSHAGHQHLIPRALLCGGDLLLSPHNRTLQTPSTRATESACNRASSYLPPALPGT